MFKSTGKMILINLFNVRMLLRLTQFSKNEIKSKSKEHSVI